MSFFPFVVRLLPADPVRRGRVVLVLVAAIFALPLAAGWLAHRFGWSPGTTGSHGQLLSPMSVAELAFPEDGGALLRLADLRGRWVLLMFDNPACGERCERKLYAIRQSRRAMGQDMSRIERIWLLTGPGRPAPALVAAIEGTRIVRATPELLDRVKSSGGGDGDIYLVDPRGSLMMRFPGDPDPAGMIKDLRRLLKYVG